MKIKSSTFDVFAVLLIVSCVNSSKIVIKRCAYVSSFTVVDAKTHLDLGMLSDVIKLNEYEEDAAFNIRVNVNDTSCLQRVQSLLVKYTSTAQPARYACEHWLPFTVFGDKNTQGIDITDYTKAAYVHHYFTNINANSTLHVTPFFNRGCQGKIRGRSKHKSFKIEQRQCFKWQQRGQDINGETELDHSGVVALSADGKILATGSPYHSGSIRNNGRVRVWTWDAREDMWIRLGQNLDGESPGDQSSMENALAMSADGDTVAMGSWLHSSGRGQVQVWRNDQTSLQWIQLGQDIHGENLQDNLGFSLDISGDGGAVVIGAPSKDCQTGQDCGQVRVWKWDGRFHRWEQLGQDIDGVGGTQFGRAVAMSGDGKTIALSAFSLDAAGHMGQVSVWRWYGSEKTWKQLGDDLKGEMDNNWFGASLAMSSDGTILAVGDYWRSSNQVGNSGKTNVFTWNGTTKSWAQMGQDVNGEGEFAFSGWDVDISSDGKYIAIGSPEENGINGKNSGRVQIWTWIESRHLWIQLAQDIDGESASDHSGKSVALSADGTIVAIGATGNTNENGLESGHVRVWQRINTTCGT